MRIPDLSKCREDFPILQREVNGQRMTYLDSAATSLKPQVVIDAVVGFYVRYTSNVHRAVHVLSEEATEAYEGA
ncbi:MAG: aminotransferase class V-fold PLP-dependent enzyme, partial [Planctomycetes bacterium]|nr:aminotransferase class V-fold PLP-dependent enzyme [Planctomycetota bacterium]